ncbi:MAG: hypothetical protein E7248_00945 [Paenibacillaceae bacterium]|nr:hypothetical protein [Paenibacillaceae bacterium]
MKRICIFLIINLMFILVGCTTSEYIDKSTFSEVESNTLKDNTINNNEEILDLPKELYKIENSAYAQPLRYDFIVADNTEFTITVSNESGDFKLGIKDKDTKDFVYPMKEYQSGSDTVTLTKGNYSIIVTERKFTGSYHIIGTTVE